MTGVFTEAKDSAQFSQQDPIIILYSKASTVLCILIGKKHSS